MSLLQCFVCCGIRREDSNPICVTKQHPCNVSPHAYIHFASKHASNHTKNTLSPYHESCIRISESHKTCPGIKQHRAYPRTSMSHEKGSGASPWPSDEEVTPKLQVSARAHMSSWAQGEPPRILLLDIQQDRVGSGSTLTLTIPPDNPDGCTRNAQGGTTVKP